MTYTLTGPIITETGTNATISLLVRAYAVELGRKTPIGESRTASRSMAHALKSYEITWDAPDDEPLNVQLSVHLPDGTWLGETELLTAIPQRLKQPVTISEIGAYEAFLTYIATDFGRLKTELRTRLSDLNLNIPDLTAADILLLENAFSGEEELFTAASITRLVASERLAAAHDLPAAFFFAIAVLQPRIAMELAAFLAYPDEDLRSILARQTDSQVIPPLPEAELFQRIDSLRDEQTTKTTTALAGRLLSRTNESPLAGLRVRAFKAAGVPVGEDFSDADGSFLIYHEHPATESMSYGLKVLRDEEVVFEVSAFDPENATLFFDLPPQPDTSPPVAALEPLKGIGETTVATLQAQRINSLKDIRQNRAALENIREDIREKLLGISEMNLLGNLSPEHAQTVLEAGFRNIHSLASADRMEVITKLGETLGEQEATTAWNNAKNADAILTGIAADVGQNPISNAPNDNGGGGNVPEEFQDLLDLYPERCGCESCENAVSRTAYLTDLLGYALQKVKVGDRLLTVDDLADNFYQAFAELPADCHANHSKIRQVRICIEVLWAYLDSNNLLVEEAAYKSRLWAIYEHILEALGTSYFELRDVRMQDTEDFSLEEVFNKLSLSFDEQNPDEAFNQIYTTPDAITENWLETTFGWRNTQRPPLEATPAPSRVAASRQERLFANWLKADRTTETLLAERPIIDPDLIGLEYLADALQGELSDLWHNREQVLEAEFNRLQDVKNNAADDASAFDAILPVNDLEELAGEENDSPISTEAYNFLKGIQKLIGENSLITEEEWEATFHILVQYHKEQALYAAWRTEEADKDISLTPSGFKIPPLDFSFPPKPTRALPAWRATRAHLRDWEELLKQRIERQQELQTDLSNAISKVEEAQLPELRNLLINATNAPGSNLYEKGQWLTEHLLIDMQMDACQLTTRIQQAIEALQLLLWSLRTRQLEDTHPDWSLEDEDFDGKWKWLGEYNRWRSAMLVYLFPENVLQPSLRRWQTPVFKELVERTRRNGRFSPESACEAGLEMVDYYTDLSSLEPGAMVKAASFIYEGSCNRRFKGITDFIYQFAKSRNSGKVYWTRYIEEDASGYATKPWEIVPGITDVVDIIGASVYFIEDRKYIYLFTKNYNNLAYTLSFIRFDLVGGVWEKSPTKLQLPEDHVKIFEAKVKQGLRTDEPPQLAIQLIGIGSIYSCTIPPNGEQWSNDNFELIVNKAKGSNFVLKDMIGIANGGYYLFAIGFAPSFSVYYRIFDEKIHNRNLDDGLWREFGGKNWVGGFRKPETNEVYGFVSKRYNAFNNISYAIISPTSFRGGRDLKDLGSFNKWFTEITGLSLREIRNIEFKDYKFSLFELLDFTLDWKNAPKDLRNSFYHWNRTKKEMFDEALKEILAKVLETLKLPNVKEEHGKDWELASKIVKAISRNDLGDLLNKIYLQNKKIKSRERGSATSEIIVRKAWQGRISKIAALPKKIAKDVFVFEAFYRKGGIDYRSFLHLIGFQPLKEAATFQITPPSIPVILTESSHQPAKLRERKIAISDLFQKLKSVPKSLKIYAEELLYFFPMHIGLQLQKRGYYDEALDWFSMVYHYNAPPAERKIYYGLVEEEDFKGSLSRKNNWLLDPLNPHSIAETRANTYTRFTLLRIIRCLLDYANAEFTRDTLESIPRARTLYQTTLKLLKEPEVVLQGGYCDLVLSEIDDTARAFIPPKYQPAWDAITSGLHQLGNQELLANTAQAIEAEVGENPDVKGALINSQQFLNTAINGQAPAMNIEERFQHRNNLMEQAHHKLIGIPIVEEAIQGAVVTTDIAVAPGGAPQPFDDTNEEEPKNTTLISNTVEVNLPSFGFCVPDNPVIFAWELEANLNLYKLQSRRNIEGLERPVEVENEVLSVDILPAIGANGQIDIAYSRMLQPATYYYDILLSTRYRYEVLLDRARQLANMAQQMEASFLYSLEKRDAELYQLLKAGQDIELTREGVKLNNLKIREAKDGIRLAELQKRRAEIQRDHYQKLLNEGLSSTEKLILVNQLLAIAASSFGSWKFWKKDSIAHRTLSATANLFQTLASFERREQEWVLARNTAKQDVLIGGQQIRLAKDRLRIVSQEHRISKLQSDHAKETLDFLVNKFTNADLYDWMSNILEGVYSTFLQQATATAKLAQRQLAFEKQDGNLSFIQSDYWENLLSLEGSFTRDGERPDRRGLTGSARLLQDITLLDQYALTANKHKQQLTKVLSLAQLMPVEFQQFRDSGQLTFDTLMKWFDQDFPGHYMRQIERVRVSVIALSPSADGIKASLSNKGISRIVAGEPFFKETTVKVRPEMISLTSAINATGQFDFELKQQNEELRPFEGIGVATSWEFEMSKAANASLDYDTIADILITIDYTALYSEDYKQQVIQQLDNTFSADRAFSFRNEFPDQWYDFNNMEEVEDTVYVPVEFEVLRADFPANLEDIKVKQLVIYFANEDGLPPMAVRLGVEGIQASTRMVYDGLVSSRHGENMEGWANFFGKAPYGTWTLAIPNNPTARSWFKEEKIKDILFVITYEGETMGW